MKKRTMFLVVGLVMAFSLVIVGATNNNAPDPNIEEKYAQLIESIDDVLIIKDNKYVYDYEEIKALVYDFDLKSLNKHTGENYTKESLLKTMIKSIDEYRGPGKP